MPKDIQSFDIVGSYNRQRVDSIDAEQTINMFEYSDAKAKKEKTLIYTSGLVDSGFVFPNAVGGFRAQFVFDNDEYHVIGSSVYRLAQNGSIALIGILINTNTGYVGIDANTFQIIFVDGSNGYIWDTLAETFTQISDLSFPLQPIDVCNLDGFFVVANGNTNNFQLSSFNQGLVWGPDSQIFTADDTGGNNWLILANTADYRTGVPFTLTTTGSLPMPLMESTTYYAITVFSSPGVIDPLHIRVADSYANAIAGTAIVLTSNGTATNTITSDGQLQLGSITTHPGNIVACRTLHRKLFLFSVFYTEVWENAGLGTNLPFRRNNTLLMEYGTPCIGSISVSFDIMCFLSQTRDGLGPVMMVSGTQAVPISSRAIDTLFSGYANLQEISDCRAFLVKENSLIFYRMNFTTANATWVYNVTLSDPTQDHEKKWHQEQTLLGNRHPSQTHAYFNGQNYVGDYFDPIMYLLTATSFTNNGQAIRRMRISRPFAPSTYNRTRIDRFQVDFLQGNLAQANFTFTVQDLATESDYLILTEDGLDLELEQEIKSENPIVPFVFLSWSKDGGQTYGSTIRAPMGMIGNRSFRTLWRKLGVVPRGQGFVVKLEFYSPIPYIILGASWNFEILPE